MAEIKGFTVDVARVKFEFPASEFTWEAGQDALKFAMMAARTVQPTISDEPAPEITVKVNIKESEGE